MNNLQKLAMMQLADSFFPAGSFTLSHGLETLIQNHKIQSASELQTFIQLLLSHKLATTDIVALVHSHRASNSNDLDAISGFSLQPRPGMSIAVEVLRDEFRASLGLGFRV